MVGSKCRDFKNREVSNVCAYEWSMYTVWGITMFTLPSKVAEYDVDYMHGRLNFKPESNKIFSATSANRKWYWCTIAHYMSTISIDLVVSPFWVKREDITGSSQKGAIVLSLRFSKKKRKRMCIAQVSENRSNHSNVGCFLLVLILVATCISCNMKFSVYNCLLVFYYHKLFCVKLHVVEINWSVSQINIV